MSENEASGMIEDLRKQIKEARGVESKTVVRFDQLKPAKMRGDGVLMTETTLSYAALFVGGQWYTTHVESGTRAVYSHPQFIELLSDENVSNIEVASEWQALA